MRFLAIFEIGRLGEPKLQYGTRSFPCRSSLPVSLNKLPDGPRPGRAVAALQRRMNKRKVHFAFQAGAFLWPRCNGSWPVV